MIIISQILALIGGILIGHGWANIKQNNKKREILNSMGFEVNDETVNFNKGILYTLKRLRQ